MADCPCEFPDSISIQCGLELVRLVSSGTLMDHKAEALKHAACLLGSTASYFQDTQPIFGAAPKPQLNTANDAAALVADCLPIGFTGPSSSQPFGLNPLLVWALTKLVEFILRQIAGD